MRYNQNTLAIVLTILPKDGHHDIPYKLDATILDVLCFFRFIIIFSPNMTPQVSHTKNEKVKATNTDHG
jgi:hypothetical protein